MESIFYKPFSCEDCKKARKWFNKEKPTEEECLLCVPRPLPENVDAVRIWGIVADQRIYAGMGECAGMNHPAIWQAIEKYEIENEVECFEKVLKCFEHVRLLEKHRKPNNVVESSKDVKW